MHLASLILIAFVSTFAQSEVISSGDTQGVKPQKTKRHNQESGPRTSVGTLSPFVPQSYVAPTYRNGAGETGVKWDTGVPTSKIEQKFETPTSGKCGDGQDLWAAAGRVMSSSVIPPKREYNLNAPSWPKLRGDVQQPHCDFGSLSASGKQSMCTSATASVLCQHFADLLHTKRVNLTAQQIAFLNGSAVRAAVNGNTFSVAKLINAFGGKSIYSSQNGGVRAVLAQAKTGDLLRYDRNNGTGHSTIFKEADDVQFCYWSSNTGTRGVGVQCEYIGVISQAVVSRFPNDLKDFAARIDEMQRTFAGFGPSTANHLEPNTVSWAGTLDCDIPGVPPVPRQ